MDNEQDLIQQMKGGNIDALHPFVVTHQEKAIRSAYLITRDEQLARDVTQAAFVQAYERIAQFDSSRRFEPWFMKIVINMALKMVKKHKRLISLEALPMDTEWLEDVSQQPEKIAQQNNLQSDIDAMLDTLSPEQRAVIVLRYYLDYSDSDIAEEVAIPVGTVKSRLHAARRQLRRLFTSKFESLGAST